MATKPRKFKREGSEVLRGNELYATAKDEVAAATIVDALERAEGRTPKNDG